MKGIKFSNPRGSGAAEPNENNLDHDDIYCFDEKYDD